MRIHRMRFTWLGGFLLALAIASPAATSENGQTFDGPGGKIYYEVTGTGPGTPLFVVNGGPGFDHTYLHVATAWDMLAKTRRVIFYDQPPDGPSHAPNPAQSCLLPHHIPHL